MTPNHNVSYCINTFICGNTINPDHELFYCQDCGAKLLVGDRYRLIEILNRDNGRTDTLVYRAIDTFNNTQVVLKIVDSPKAEAQKYLRREYEFLIGATPPFARIQESDLFEWIPDPNHSFFKVLVLVLPWIEGKDSLTWIQENGTISEADCIQWIFQILNYLESLSNTSMMHRDIKPENIIVCPDQTIKLIDYGSIRRIDEQYVCMLEGTVRDGDNIRRATRIFTFGYSPPEQLNGRAVKQSDYFALGKTIIFWLSGKVPRDLIDENPNVWIDDCSQASTTLIKFIQWLSAKNVGSRPLDATYIRDYLEERYPYDFKAEQSRKRRRSNWLNRVIFSTTGLFFAIGCFLFLVSNFYLTEAKRSIEGDDYQGALRELQVARSLNPFSIEIVRQQGYAYLWSGRNEEARKKFEEAVQRVPNDWGTLYHLGVLNEEIDINTAINFYEKAITVEPMTIESELRLARIYLRKNDFSKAQKYLNQVLKKIDNYPDKTQLTDQYFVNFYLGWLNLERDNYELAYSNLKTALLSTTQDSRKLSVTTGDIVCLLAESATILNKEEALSFWKECFITPVKTQIGIEIKDRRIDESAKSLLNDNIR